jgi:hypothetical protein
MQYKLKIFFLSLLFLAIQPEANAQKGWDLVRDTLMQVLNDAEIEDLLEAERLTRQAVDTLKSVQKLDAKLNEYRDQAENAKGLFKRWKYKREAKDIAKKAKIKRLRAAKLLETAYDIKYHILWNRILFFENDDVPEAYRARVLRHEASELFKKAREKLYGIEPDDDDYGDIASNLNEIHELKEAGIEKEIEAICLFLNCRSQHGELKDQGTKTAKETSENENNGQTEKDTTQVQETPPGNEDGFVSKIAEECDSLWFRVQIIATSRPISEKQFRAYYKTEDKYEVIDKYEDGLYRYWVGYFEHYEPAKEYNDKTDVEDSFVIGFCDGERIDIERAIEIDKAKQQLKSK